MKKRLSQWALSLWGWKISGSNPHDVPKAIFAVVPHTSWVDFPLGIFVRNVLGADIKFLAKKGLFKFPLGTLMRWLGGYPVDRTKSTSFVDAVVDIFNAHERFYIAIAPEGTRKKVEKLKSGYYWIAKIAEIAIIMVSMDYENKVVTFSAPFYPTENAESDMTYLAKMMSGVEGRVPEYSYNLHSS